MINPLDMTGRTVLVTGASSGLGRGTCLLLSQLGAKVILVARSEDGLNQTLSQMEGTGHRVAPFDVAQVEAIPEWMKSLAAETGPLSGLVHSAGIHTTHPLRVLQPSKIDEVMRINFTAAVALTKGLRQRGVKAERASVVYISSVMGLVGQRGVTAYCASKGALIAAAKPLALELADENIRVNCIAPGHVRTGLAMKSESLLSDEQIRIIEDMHPLGIGEEIDVANAVAYLLAETGRWITGQTLVVDGGYTIH